MTFYIVDFEHNEKMLDQPNVECFQWVFNSVHDDNIHVGLVSVGAST